MSTSNNLEPPKRDSKDLTRQTVKTVLSLLSLGAADEVFELLVKEPFQERLEIWAREVSEALRKLFEAFNELDPESLITNEAFKTTLLNATREAIATHRRETIEALRNAVLNSALPNAPDDNRQKVFVQWASELTPWHVKLLALFQKPGVQIPELNFNDPKWRMQIGMLDQLAAVIETEYPEMEGNFQICMQIIHDLHQRGLLVHEIPARQSLADINERPILSPIAREFLNFITSPIDESSE